MLYLNMSDVNYSTGHQVYFDNIFWKKNRTVSCRLLLLTDKSVYYKTNNRFKCYTPA